MNHIMVNVKSQTRFFNTFSSPIQFYMFYINSLGINKQNFLLSCPQHMCCALKIDALNIQQNNEEIFFVTLENYWLNLVFLLEKSSLKMIYTKEWISSVEVWEYSWMCFNKVRLSFSLECIAFSESTTN